MFGQDYTQELEVVEQGVCAHYLRGECKHGSECIHPHPAELSSKLEPKTDFKVSTTTNEACQLCLERMVPCDKVGRAKDQTDPCSECRHFGGEGCVCVIQEGASRSSQMWQTMLGNAAQQYALPAHKPRDATRKKRGKKVSAQPMGNDQLINGWKGETREGLLKVPDMFPPDVRARPRAYLTPPPLSRQQQRSRRYFDNQREGPAAVDAPSKRKRRIDDISGDSQLMVAQYMVPDYQMPQIPIPARDSLGQAAVAVTFQLEGDRAVSSTVRYPGVGGRKGAEVTSWPPLASSMVSSVQHQTATSKGFGGSHAHSVGPKHKKRRPPITSTPSWAQEQTQPSPTVSTGMEVDAEQPSAESAGATVESQAVVTHLGVEMDVPTEHNDDDDNDSVAFVESDAGAEVEALHKQSDNDNDSVGFVESP